jgi:hypothetical protein
VKTVQGVAMPRKTCSPSGSSDAEVLAATAPEISTDRGELWQTLRLDAERAAAGEEMLRGFLDLAVLPPSRPA